MVVAIAEDNAINQGYPIGNDNKLLCHLPADMKMFRELTTGHTVIMGRKTFESLPNGALPNRQNIVISRTLPKKDDDNFMVCRSLEDAFDFCKNEKEVFIIGGADIYNATMDIAHYLYITKIKHTFENADTFFPLIDTKKQWRKISQQDHVADEKNPYDYSFIKYKKNNFKRKKK